MNPHPLWKIVLALAFPALLLMASATAQTTTDGNVLACSSSGSGNGTKNTWTLKENGFVGTFINVSAAGSVTFAVQASKSSNDNAGTPKMRLRVADFSSAEFGVTTGGATYTTFSQTWSLPAGTYAVRIEYLNDGGSDAVSPLQLNVRSLAVTGATVLNSDTDANALAAADTYIANCRKSPANVTVTAGGKPLANTQVRIRLKRHAFLFGTAVYGAGEGDADWIKGAGTDAVNCRNFLTSNFNAIVPENAGKWTYNEGTRDVVTMGAVDAMMDFAESNSLRVRMHGVLWDVDEPAWVNALEALAAGGDTAAKNDLRGQVTERIGYFVGGAGSTRRASRYLELDGVNEGWHSTNYTTIYGADGVAGILNEIQTAMTAIGATATISLNDFNILQYSTISTSSSEPDPAANWYRQQAESLLNAGAKGSLGGLGIQYYAIYNANSPHSPARMLKVFNNLAVTGLKLSLTEFGVQSTNSPTQQNSADILRDTVRMAFGHPNMGAFFVWGFWQTKMWSVAKEAYFVDSAWNLSIAGKTWQQMMGVHDWGLPGVSSWTTDLTLTTDAVGQVSIPSGFYGDYEVTTPGGTGTLTLAKGTTTYSVPLAGPAATPNLLSNGGFESGSTGGWTTWGPAISATTAQAHSGSFSGLVSGRTIYWQGIVQDVTAALAPGRTYDVSFWVRWESGVPAPLYATLVFNDSAGDHYVGIASGANATSTGWTRLTGSFTFNPTGTVNSASIYTQSDDANATRSLYVDDASLTVREAAASVQPAGGSPGAGTVTYNVNFALPVTGFSSSDVVVMHSGTSHASLTIGGSGANYSITLGGLSGTGSLSISVPSGAAAAQGDGAASLGSGPAPRVFTLATTAGTGGQASANPLAGAYPAGAAVSLTATPQTGYLFSGWSGSLTGSSNPATLNILDASLAAASFSTNPAIYDGWSISKLGSIQSPTDDFDRDGVSNLLEYAMGMEPGTPDAQNLPAVGTAPGGRLQLTYRRNTLATDLTYTVQGVSDLSGTWQPLVNPPTEDLGTVSGVQTLRATDTTNPGSRRFLRLNVTK